MNTQMILEELLGLLEANGVAIRRERLGGNAGGLCKVKDEWIFFLDTESTSTESAAHCAEAVLNRVDTEKIYIRPEVREFINKFGKG